MSTEQSYVGRGGNPLTSAQTVKSDPKSSLTGGDRLRGPLALHYQILHEHIDGFAQERRASDDIEGLADTLMGYLSNAIGYDPEDTALEARRYELRAHHLDRIYTTLRLMVSVTQIKEGWASVERFKANSDQP